MYRIVNGKRQKFRFSVDSSLVILEETPCKENGIPITKNTVKDLPNNSSDQVLQERGYGFHKTEDGSTFIDKVPKSELKINAFFVLHTPCDFPNCEELRKAYMRERQKLEDDSDGPCPTCVYASLQRKYSNMIRQALLLEDVSDKASTGD